MLDIIIYKLVIPSENELFVWLEACTSQKIENFSIILNKLNYSKGSGLQLIYMTIGPIQFLFIFIPPSPSFHLFIFFYGSNL